MFRLVGLHRNKGGEGVSNTASPIVNPYMVPQMVSKPTTDNKVVVGFQPLEKKMKNVIPRCCFSDLLSLNDGLDVV